jgi:hypothetical protein
LLAAGGLTKPGEERLHCCAGRNLALLLATYSVGERKQPAMRLLLLRGFGEYATQVVFVVVAYSPAVGSLNKVKS